MTGDFRKLVQVTLLYVPAQFVPPAVQFATTVLWTHLLDPATFGFVTLIIAAQEVAAIFGLSVWSLYVLRFRARYEERDDAGFRAMDRRMAFTASLLQVGLTPLLLILLRIPCDGATIVATAAYLVSRMLLSHYGDWARASHSIFAYTSGQLIGSVVGSALSIIAILYFGPIGAIAIGAMALGQFIALATVVKQTGIQFGLGRFDPEILRDAGRYGGPAIVGGIVGWGAGNAIRVLVQYWEGAFALGLISVGWGLGQRLSGVLAMLLTAAAFPLAVKYLESGDRRGALQQVSMNGQLLLAMLLPAVVGVAILAHPIVNLLIAEQFREVTFIMLPIAMLAASVRFLRLHTCDQALLLLERTDVSMKIAIVETASNIVFCAIGLKMGGLIGAALGITLGTALTCAGAFIMCFWKFELPTPSPANVLRIFAATAAMALAVRALPVSQSGVWLALAVGVGAISYLGVLAALFPESWNQLARRCRQLTGAPA